MKAAALTGKPTREKEESLLIAVSYYIMIALELS